MLATGTGLTAAALVAEAFAPSLWLFACGMVVFGLGFGAVDAAVNVHAAHHFTARQINWMHASYGAGATLGPLLATLMLSDALTWQGVYGIFGAVQAVLAVAFAATGRAWATPGPAPTPAPTPVRPVPPGGGRRRPTTAVWGALVFVAVENGIESGAGIWGYVFLTAGRGLSHTAAGAALSAYWLMMFLGRVVLGAVAERVGQARLLGAAVAVVSVGCALMAVPGPGPLAVAGLLVVGFAAAPIFPLFTLATGERVGPDDATRMVSLQVAASAVGSAAVPAGLGLAIGAFTASALGPWLLVPSAAMYAVYRRLTLLVPGCNRHPMPGGDDPLELGVELEVRHHRAVRRRAELERHAVAAHDFDRARAPVLRVVDLDVLDVRPRRALGAEEAASPDADRRNLRVRPRVGHRRVQREQATQGKPNPPHQQYDGCILEHGQRQDVQQDADADEHTREEGELGELPAGNLKPFR